MDYSLRTSLNISVFKKTLAKKNEFKEIWFSINHRKEIFNPVLGKTAVYFTEKEIYLFLVFGLQICYCVLLD